MKREKFIYALNVVYACWFILSFACYVSLKPLALTETIDSVPVFFSSVYNFTSLAIVGLLLAVVTPRKERIIPAFLTLLAGLSNLITGLVLMLEGRKDIIVFNLVFVGSCISVGALYILVYHLLRRE